MGRKAAQQAGEGYVATGTPEQVARNSQSFTGRGKFLSRRRSRIPTGTNPSWRATRSMGEANGAAWILEAISPNRWLQIILVSIFLTDLAGIPLNSAIPKKDFPRKHLGVLLVTKEKDDHSRRFYNRQMTRSTKWISQRRLIRFKNISRNARTKPYPHFQLGYAFSGLETFG